LGLLPRAANGFVFGPSRIAEPFYNFKNADSMKYDPHKPIDPVAWLEIDESERIDSVRQYHQRQRIRLPNNNIHAIIHVVVENQVAMGDDYAAKSVLLRLMNEGLDRHEAVHAIGSVLAEEIFGVLKRKTSGTDLNTQYLEKLNRLTAESWRKLSP
jgi:hypothetical protein